jgi:hypothetical protein
MGTVRFSKVLEACGKPDIHLLLIDPPKDKTLQAAIKSDRVMTLYQQSGGTDHGIIGFEQGRSRQFLVFPKPLRSFQGQRIVGIKYELLEDVPFPKKESAKKEAAKPAEKPGEPAPALVEKASSAMTKAAGSASGKRAGHRPPTVVSKPSSPKPKDAAPANEEQVGQEGSETVSVDKVIKFQKAEPDKSPTVDADEIKKLKHQVREAMDALEQGKQVVAFNLLKRILDEDKSG